MKQVMVVRRDLKMGKGKIAAQCCPGSIGSYKRTDSKLIKKWESDGYAKVVCKVDSLEELLDLKKEADKNNVSKEGESREWIIHLNFMKRMQLSHV